MASLNLKHTANEADYIYSSQTPKINEPPSPASKKSIQSLNNTFKKPSIPKLNLEPKKSTNKVLSQQEEEENNVVQQYLQQASMDLQRPMATSTPAPVNSEELPTPVATSTPLLAHQHSGISEPASSVVTDFLEGKVIFLYGYTSDEDIETMIKDCHEFGANIVDDSYDKIVDYVIVPSEGILSENIPMKYRNLVTDIWIEDSFKENRCVEVDYYHKPFLMFKDEDKILRGEQFVISNYQSNERSFLRNLILNLGADFSEVFKKTASPILISPTPVGKKYTAALNWGE